VVGQGLQGPLWPAHTSGARSLPASQRPAPGPRQRNARTNVSTVSAVCRAAYRATRVQP